jgi:hypothetical protein
MRHTMGVLMMDVVTKQKLDDTKAELYQEEQRARDLANLDITLAEVAWLSHGRARQTGEVTDEEFYQRMATQLTNALVFLARAIPEGAVIGNGVVEAGRAGILSLVVRKGTFAK